MKALVVALCCFLMISTAQANEELSENIRSSWGVGVGFTNSTYVDQGVNFKILTPGYVKLSDGWMRFFAEFGSYNLFVTLFDDESYSDFSAGVLFESKIVNEIFNGYTLIGLGNRQVPDDYYDGSLLFIPIAFGLNFYTNSKLNNGERSAWDPVMGIEYRLPLLLNYDEDKAVGSGVDKMFKSGAFFFNVKWLF